eukprot:CAMPEP_0113938578 /NCGR_PEP_ID=MMETSP1339-20121228/5001_1 /TAXON_ID=94617 /ORGANISM="Fibrocapsa japonica" /LENGTH=57 /DNA_ID=CAMNT_0000941761 /DNA_START=40 /DNA_END=210 /DNA_ORIENTATION=+ /assembly_acc=CAM_ASM_000762
MALELDPVLMLPESNLLDVRQQKATKGFVSNKRSTAKMGEIFFNDGKYSSFQRQFDL